MKTIKKSHSAGMTAMMDRVRSTNAANPRHPKIALSEWIKTQPASTRRGIWRGHFVLPDYVVQGE